MCPVASLSTLAALAAASLGGGPPSGFAVLDAFPEATFEAPVQVVFLPDGRAFVVEVRGVVWTILPDGTQLPTPFIDLTDEVRSGSDLGLLGVAIDPEYATSPFVYFGYTVDPNGDGVDNDPHQFTRVTRYRADALDPNVADPTSRQVLIGETWTTGMPSLSTSHSIGALRFGRDHTLLVAMGDGAHFHVVDPGGLDPEGFGPGRTDPAEDIGSFRARTLDSLAGKILRVDKETGLGLSSNPYWDGDPTSKRSRVWVYGVRNPFRFSVRPETGSLDPDAGDPGVLYVGDVGWNTYEELDVVAQGGTNLGWPCVEGPMNPPEYQEVTSTEAGNENVLCGAAPSAENPDLSSPPALYVHHTNAGASSPSGMTGVTVIGGAFYTGTTYPAEYAGRFFMADWGRGWLRSIEVTGNDVVTGWNDFLFDADGIVDVEVDPANGDIVYVAIFAGEVRRIRYVGLVDSPESSTGASPGAAELALRVHPTPFTRSTRVGFDLPAAGAVSLHVFDSGGRLVRTLLDGSSRQSGRHALEWNGQGDSGRVLEPGVYFSRIRALGRVETTKIVLR